MFPWIRALVCDEPPAPIRLFRSRCDDPRRLLLRAINAPDINALANHVGDAVEKLRIVDGEWWKLSDVTYREVVLGIWEITVNYKPLEKDVAPL